MYKILFILFAFVIYACSDDNSPKKSAEALKLGFETVAQMTNLQNRGYGSYQEYLDVLNFTPEYFNENCKDSTSESYLKLCYGKKISWYALVEEDKDSDGRTLKIFSSEKNGFLHVFPAKSNTLESKLSGENTGQVQFDAVLRDIKDDVPIIDEILSARYLSKAEIEDRHKTRIATIKDKRSRGEDSKDFLNAKIQKKLPIINEYLKNVKWNDVFIMRTQRERKGGVFIENNFFSDNKIVVKSDQSSTTEDVLSVDLSSIRSVDDQVKEVIIKESDSLRKNIAYSVGKYMINCPSLTYRQMEGFWIKIKEVQEIKEIDQKSGNATTKVIPAGDFAEISKFDSKWNPINNSSFKKLHDVVCNSRLELNIENQFR
jgi:hypothetical protein